MKISSLIESQQSQGKLNQNFEAQNHTYTHIFIFVFLKEILYSATGQGGTLVTNLHTIYTYG